MKKGIDQIAQVNVTLEQDSPKSLVAYDVEFNTRHQLTYAASILLHIDYAREGKDFDFEKYSKYHLPPNWILENWRNLLCKSYPNRVALAGSFMARELDRQNMVGDYSAPGLVKR